MAGDSDVKWGLDRNGDSLDGWRNDSVRVTWPADGLSGGSYSRR